MRIELQRIRKEDMTALLHWASTYEQMVQWSGPWNFRFPLDERQMAEFFLKETVDDGLNRMEFKAVHTGTQQMVGQTGFSRIRQRTRCGHLGPVIVDPSMRAKGVGTQMVCETVRIGFEDLGLHRIELVVFDFNHQAISCYERVGFRREGLLRNIVNVNGSWWHWVAMSILEHEWSNDGQPSSEKKMT